MNILNLIRHHKKNCDGNCGASLIILREMAKDCGVKFTKKEDMEFI